MSLLTQYLQKEQQLKQLQEELARLEGDDRFKAELDFKQRLESLMWEYDRSAADVLDLLDPTGQAKPATGTTQQRRKRRLRVYRNPITGDVVETRGGNNKTLKAWKDEHGEETVESWLVRVED